jgi:hypothetical protein
MTQSGHDDCRPERPLSTNAAFSMRDVKFACKEQTQKSAANKITHASERLLWN